MIMMMVGTRIFLYFNLKLSPAFKIIYFLFEVIIKFRSKLIKFGNSRDPDLLIIIGNS